MIKWYGGFVVSLMLSKQDEGDHEKQIKILIWFKLNKLWAI